MDLTPEQTDRACGAVLAAGLGGFAPGEWSDDTAQAFAILEVASIGADLRDDAALDAIAANLAQ